MVCCGYCGRSGHHAGQCQAETCPGCGKVINSVHNSKRGNENNLEVHMDSCPDCDDDEDECQKCGYGDHFTHDCNALWCPEPGCGKLIQSQQNSLAGNRNNLGQHQKTHRARDLACPACGERRFGSGSAVAIHFEGGYCSSCRDKDSAEKVVYDFVKRKMPNYTNQAALTWDCTYEITGEVPRDAYCCKYCDRVFQKFASLAQHIEDRHRMNPPQLPAILNH